MVKEFELTNNALMNYFLGIKVKQSVKGIFISQKGYAKNTFEKFNTKNYTLVNIPMECRTKLSKFDDGVDVDSTYYRSLIESLRYLTCTRFDIL